MIQHPEILQKAQKELDSVVGNSRLPTFSDRANLPYVNAVVNETLRLSSPVPLGQSHAFTTMGAHAYCAVYF